VNVTKKVPKPESAEGKKTDFLGRNFALHAEESGTPYTFERADPKHSQFTGAANGMRENSRSENRHQGESRVKGKKSWLRDSEKSAPWKHDRTHILGLTNV